MMRSPQKSPSFTARKTLISGVLRHALGDCTVSRNSAAVRAVTERSKHRSAPISGGPVPCGVALDRPARPSGLGRICNLSGSLNRWSFRTSEVLQDATRDASDLLKSFRVPIHESKHGSGANPKSWTEIPKSAGH